MPDQLTENSNGDNLTLWNAVSHTDETKIKQVKIGYQFTAIDPTYQRKCATELWGPYGTNWGLREMVWGYTGDPPMELWLEAFFFWPDGQFSISSDIKWKAGDHCRKKLQTDLLTKALSYLGFNTDVWEGRFEDSPYVDAGDAVAPLEQKTEEIISALKSAETIERLDTLFYAAKSRKLNRFNFGQVKATYEARTTELTSTTEAEEVF